MLMGCQYEGLDLAALKRLFPAVGAADIEALVRDAPTGSYSRRFRFLHEGLTGRQLDLPNADSGSYVPAIDPIGNGRQRAGTRPAMAAGVTPKLWEMADMVKMLEDWEAEVAK